ncbi:MAG: prepilin-type N-terminal cleavage/methylation domain-containing protein [Phycisphaerales bacterium]|nr:prepilin-type N-terminal cleavage/methylation domain-containing protein [Phycisphaerales bacterium]
MPRYRGQPNEAPPRRRTTLTGRCRTRGFTLVEWAVVISITAVLLAAGTVAFRGFQQSSVLAQAKNAVVTYSNIARNYAVANHIETMLVVNPYNGRFEIWHLNPPKHGGLWDPYSDNDGSNPDLSDGYVHAPVLDGSAALPIDNDGDPIVAVHPIDYADVDSDNTPVRSTSPGDSNLDNLIWAAFCFDENGKLVTRTRRIATRSYRFRNGLLRPVNERNRLDDESPDMALLKSGALVTSSDTAITSTRGFIISDKTKMDAAVGSVPTAANLVNNWLFETRPSGRFVQFADTVVLDRFSGQKLAGAP